MTSEAEAAKARAELRFKRSEQQQAEAAKVRAEIEAARIAQDAKTIRLRALRLAKEAEDRQAVVLEPKKPSRRK